VTTDVRNGISRINEIQHREVWGLQGALIFWMDSHKARTEAIQEEMKAKLNINKERLKAAIATGCN
jgi:hypothetical protein